MVDFKKAGKIRRRTERIRCRAALARKTLKEWKDRYARRGINISAYWVPLFEPYVRIIVTKYLPDRTVRS